MNLLNLKSFRQEHNSRSLSLYSPATHMICDIMKHGGRSSAAKLTLHKAKLA
jgi:hypothetical protein